MAQRKALFTTKDDFRVDMFSFPIEPYIYFDGEKTPTDTPIVDTGLTQEIRWRNGSPTPVDGVVGKANMFTGESLHFRNWGIPPFTRASLSLWVKFSEEDLNEWSILATNRGDGWTNRALHVATYNGQLNIRLYGAGDSAANSLSIFTNGQDAPYFTFEPNKWYHVALIVDLNRADRVVALVNGETKIEAYFTFDFNMEFKNSFTIGDMYDGTGYPLNGTIIDEVIYAINENAWSKEQAIEYYNTIAKGEYLDFETLEGSLQLGKGIDGTHPTKTMVWETPIIDLGGRGRFVDYGVIRADYETPNGTSLKIYTRSSEDGSIWDTWRVLADDGKIQSPNTRYLQIRVELSTIDPTKTPILHELSVWEEEKEPEWIPLPNLRVRPDAPLLLYKDLETGLTSLGELKNAFDIIIEEEINGEDTLRFKLPIQDEKRKEIGDEPVEYVAVIGERYYIVKEVIDIRNSDGTFYTEFICEARWTELRDFIVENVEVQRATAREALEAIFKNIKYEEGDSKIDWTIGNVDMKDKRRTLRGEWKDVLSLIHEVVNTWGGELLFDTKNKIVHLLERIGENTGVRFYYNKNLKTMERVIDTYDLITRIYPKGKGNLDITTVNDGIPYLENTKWVEKLKLRRKVIPYYWKDERYTIPENLKEDAQKMLDERAKPKVTYITTVYDLSAITGHEHEAFNLGDIISAYDPELFDEEIENRVVRRRMNVRMPENTEIELSQPVKTLADVRSRAIDEQIQQLVESDPLSNTDIQQMTVFNHLLNSRADEGINADWVKVGTDFEVANVGFSGNWSFKVTPDYGKENSLTQTVEGVSHRSTYTVSAAVATEGEITRGSSDDAFVGIKVIVHYQDGGEPDVFYLAVPDVAGNEPPDSN